MLNDILKSKNLTVYKASKESGISYTTLHDIVIEKTDIKKASAETLYRLASYLQMSMEALYTINDNHLETIFIHNNGRNIIVETSKSRHQYLGPKNLISFSKINKVGGNVIYVECIFMDDETDFIVEEDYIDLQDILEEDRFILNYSYEVQIGYGRKITKYDLIDESIMVSDNMAILRCFRPENPTRLVEVRNLSKTEMKAVIRLCDYAVVETNMSTRMQKRAVDAVIRNSELIVLESAGEHSYA